MGWIEHAIWWQVYPLGFCGAPIRAQDIEPEPRLRRLLPWLDHAIELGASGLLLGPVFDSQSHGYDSLDQFRIDPRLGGDLDFDDLLTACKERGLRVVLDGVFSHVGDRHPLLRHVLAEGPASENADLFDIDWDADGGPAPRVFEGHPSLARLNHTSDAAVAYVADVLEYWLERGIDGWRLDAAYSVPVSFWARVLERVRPRFADAWFLGEVIHGDYTEFVRTSDIDTVTQYELWKAIWSSICDRNLFELDWALMRHSEFLAHFIPNTFIGNHDVTRIASTLGPDGAVAALAILLTAGGIPSIYAGDELGLTGIKENRLGGDDAVRPAFPEAPAQFTDAEQRVYRAYQDLIGLRRRHPWLVTATTTRLALDNTHYTYRATSRDGCQWLDVEIALDDAPSVTIRNAAHTLWRQH